jgi:hypothetical protein
VGHQFTRKELYDLIWTERLRTAAARLGLSDVGLAKVCHAAQIPIPFRGYWAEGLAGQNVERRELPPRPLGRSDRVHFGRKRALTVDAMAQEQAESTLSAPSFEESVPETIARVRKLVGKVTCTKSLERPHSAIAPSACR